MMAPTEIFEKDKAHDRGARRREKSRDAARSRRQQESDTFNEICQAIPVPAKQLAQMDRSTVMRLLISFMKLRNVTNCMGFTNEEIKQEVSTEMPRNEEYINALNGFIIVLSHDCDILFVSANVKQYIGIAGLDLIGQNLFGYTHEGDHSEITNCLKTSSEERKAHSFFMRMKSTLTSSGKNVNLKSARYKVLQCEGVVSQSADLNQAYMIAYCEPIPHPENIEMVLDSSTFLSQHSLDMKFTFCDTERISSLMGYNNDEMVGQSFYNFCHTEDIKALDNAMKKLFRLRQVTTNRYRLLAKYGGYAWVISQATIINNPRNQQPSYIVCVHYVISGVIDGNSIVSLPQLEFSESSENTFVKEEFAETPKELEPFDCTEDLFCDSTNSIFSDNILDERPDVALSSDATSEVLIPVTESMETMANNAPSIGDEVGCTEFSFNEMFGIDDLYNNAPSIGDPLLMDPFVFPAQQGASVFPDNSVNLDQMNEFLIEEINGKRTGPTMASETKVKIRGWPQSSTAQQCSTSPTAPVPISKAPQRRLPTGDFQVVTIPKSQYKRHIQPEINLPRDMVYTVNPPDDPLMKKQKCQARVEPCSLNTQWKMPYSDFQCSTNKADFLLKGEHNPGETNSLSSLLLQPGYKCDNLDFGMEPSRDRDPSWPLSPVTKNSSLLPVLSLYDCEVNAPVEQQRIYT